MFLEWITSYGTVRLEEEKNQLDKNQYKLYLVSLEADFSVKHLYKFLHV